MNKYLPNSEESSMQRGNFDYPVSSPVSNPWTDNRDPLFKNYHINGEKDKEKLFKNYRGSDEKIKGYVSVYLQIQVL